MATENRNPNQVFALVDLADNTVVSAQRLPDYMIGLKDESLADLSWTAPDFDGIWVGKGFWPLSGYRSDGVDPSYTVDAVSKTVSVTYGS